MLLNLSEHVPESLHDQMRRQIMEMIAAGDLKPDDCLLPIPQMAREQKVSSSTVRRSYQRLAEMGLIEERQPDNFRILRADPGNLKKQPAANRKNGGYEHKNVKSEAADPDPVSIHRELKKAARMQRSLLPVNLPVNPFVDTRFFTVSAQPIGGDLVDIFNIDHQCLAFLIADACGNGLSAALLITRVQAIIRNESRHNSQPAVIINQLACQMEEAMPRDRFITLFFGVYDPGSCCLRYVNAGHPFPLFYSRQPGEKKINGINPALGVVRGHCYKGSTKTLSKGDCLLLYTDGISEAMNPQKEEYGEKKIASMLQRYHYDPKKLIDTLIRDLTLFTATQEVEDDRSVLVVKIIN